jgi:hypothetical protein
MSTGVKREVSKAPFMGYERALHEAYWFSDLMSRFIRQPDGTYRSDDNVYDSAWNRYVIELTATEVKALLMNYLIKELKVTPSMEFINMTYEYLELIRSWNSGIDKLLTHPVGQAVGGKLVKSTATDMVSCMTPDYFEPR